MGGCDRRAVNKEWNEDDKKSFFYNGEGRKLYTRQDSMYIFRRVITPWSFTYPRNYSERCLWVSEDGTERSKGSICNCLICVAQIEGVCGEDDGERDDGLQWTWMAQVGSGSRSEQNSISTERTQKVFMLWCIPIVTSLVSRQIYNV